MELLDTGNKTVDRCRHCLQILVTATTRIGTLRKHEIIVCANKNAQGIEVSLATIPCWIRIVSEMSFSTAMTLDLDLILGLMMTSRDLILISFQAWVYKNRHRIFGKWSCRLSGCTNVIVHCHLDYSSSDEFARVWRWPFEWSILSVLFRFNVAFALPESTNWSCLRVRWAQNQSHFRLEAKPGIRNSTQVPGPARV